MAASETTAARRAPDLTRRPSLMALTLGSVGVVYGDIGTSPLYAFREAVMAASDDGDRDARDRARRSFADPLVAHHRRSRSNTS